MKRDPSPIDIVRQVSAAVNSPESFNFLTTGNMWRRTLRTWRANTIKELQLDRNLSKHAETKNLVDMCCASLAELGALPSSPASRDAHLLARCRDVVDQIRPRPTSTHEWTVVLTWLAVILDPITLDYGLQSLEKAFVIAADLDEAHPITKDQAHRKRKSLVDSRRAEGKSARILQPNDSLDNDGTPPDFYWRYASEEVAILLDRYLPLEIRLELQRWNLRAPLTCGPRSSHLEPQNSCRLSGQRFAETGLPELRIIMEARSAIVAPKPPPPGPPKRKPRASIGTPAEVRISGVEDRRKTLRSSCQGGCLNTPYFGD